MKTIERLSRCLFIAAAMMILCTSASAATYYVDYASGSDANAGTSTSIPWKHCPGDTNAAGLAASANLGAADTIYFRTGTTYVMSSSGITLASGASGQPITYDGSTWGGGDRCILTGENAVTSNDASGFKENGSAVSYLVIKGFNFRDIGGYTEDDPIWDTTDPVTSPPKGTAIDLTRGGVDITIDDCLFAEVGQWQGLMPMSETNSVTGTCISLTDNTNVTISDCDFTRTRTGVRIHASETIEDVTVSNCQFHNNMNWLIDIAPNRTWATLKDITVEGCTFYNYRELDQSNWEGYGDAPHQNAIFLRSAVYASIWTNVVIRDSLFYSDDRSSGGTSSIYLSQGPSADIYNCAFLNDVGGMGAIDVDHNKRTGMTQTVRIWNNTFVGDKRCVFIRGNPSTVEIMNNVFDRTATFEAVSLTLPSLDVLTMDYNVFYTENPLRCVYNGGYRSFAAWKTLSGKDANSVWGDPLLADVTGLPSTWDARPTESSPAVGLGSDLSSRFTVDRDGNTRTVPWDAGAYILPSSAPCPGDADLDGDVDIDDFVILKGNFGSGTTWAEGDFDSDGDVDIDDFVILKQNFGSSCE